MLRPLVALILLPVLTGAVAAAEPVTEKKKPAVSERPFDVPLDFRSRSDFNIGDSTSIPSGRLENLQIEPKAPFFGLGLKQPFGSTK